MATIHTFKRPQLPVFKDVFEERFHVRRRLILACRIMHRQGWGIACSVHLSARDAVDKSSMFVVPDGTPLASVRDKDLMRLSITDGIVIERGFSGGGCGLTPAETSRAELMACLDNAHAAELHRAVYRTRADVGGIIHGSSPNIRAFAMSGHDLQMILQDSCTFYKKISRLPFEANLGVLGDPAAVSTCLGDGKGLILDKQGILLVGAWIEPCISYYVRMESLCRCQLLAQAAARAYKQEMVIIGEEEVAFTAANNGSEHHAWLHAKPYFDREAKFFAKEDDEH